MIQVYREAFKARATSFNVASALNSSLFDELAFFWHAWAILKRE
jgi:hypothetical protein